ncbi:MAG: hypothetical protein EZS28_023286, partial [Streblomastix strix]
MLVYRVQTCFLSSHRLYVNFWPEFRLASLRICKSIIWSSL